jgi:MoaE-MoaD fusion protein
VRVEVRLFGGLADRAGTSRTTVELPTAARVADLREAVAAAHPQLAGTLERVSVAVDLEVVRDDHPLVGGEEVALLPPVAGGADPVGHTRTAPDGARILTGLTATPLPVDATLAAIGGTEVGGSVSFLGTVRDHAPDVDGVVGLDYHAYPEMAERVLDAIADEVLSAHPEVRGIALLHRVGELAVGDHTILVACAAAHREAAFAACRAALEQVKDRVPVWKREHVSDGTSRWVGLP